MELVDLKEYQDSKREYEHDVMAVACAYLVRAFNCCRDIKPDDETLKVMEQITEAFCAADLYMSKREPIAKTH